ncbi:serum amyloid A-5 protein-like [Saccostrea cucullata]|uniref:serum amyloid A-5 protein-like n=1 Tax=Saccostrea cuccullata TaxID=36930 RepID=UPI002ED4FA3A
MRTTIIAVVLVAFILTEHSMVEGWWGRSRGSSRSRSRQSSSRSLGGRFRSVVRSGVNRAKDVFRKAKERVRSGADFAKQAAQGAGDMRRAYSDMKEANWKNSDKYFHARGNYDAAKRGPGGAWAAKVISDGRESYQSKLSGQGPEDTAADQAANEWGRKGGDPNKYRPKGLPDKYR